MKEINMKKIVVVLTLLCCISRLNAMQEDRSTFKASFKAEAQQYSMHLKKECWMIAASYEKQMRTNMCNLLKTLQKDPHDRVAVEAIKHTELQNLLRGFFIAGELHNIDGIVDGEDSDDEPSFSLQQDRQAIRNNALQEFLKIAVATFENFDFFEDTMKEMEQLVKQAYPKFSETVVDAICNAIAMRYIPNKYDCDIFDFFTKNGETATKKLIEADHREFLKTLDNHSICTNHTITHTEDTWNIWSSCLSLSAGISLLPAQEKKEYIRCIENLRSKDADVTLISKIPWLQSIVFEYYNIAMMKQCGFKESKKLEDLAFFKAFFDLNTTMLDAQICLALQPILQAQNEILDMLLYQLKCLEDIEIENDTLAKKLIAGTPSSELTDKEIKMVGAVINECPVLLDFDYYIKQIQSDVKTKESELEELLKKEQTMLPRAQNSSEGSSSLGANSVVPTEEEKTIPQATQSSSEYDNRSNGFFLMTIEDQEALAKEKEEEKKRLEEQQQTLANILDDVLKMSPDDLKKLSASIQACIHKKGN